MEENKSVNHNIFLEDRKKLTLTGVSDVLTFDNQTILLETSLGKLTLKGENLRIESFDKQIGDLVSEGEFFALVYQGNDNGGGFFAKLLR